jgi:hypothetical protein
MELQITSFGFCTLSLDCTYQITTLRRMDLPSTSGVKRRKQRAHILLDPVDRELLSICGHSQCNPK